MRGGVVFWIMGVAFVLVYAVLAGLVRFSESIVRPPEGGARD